MDYEFERLLWVRGKGESETRKPILVGILGEKMHWHAGMTRCMWEPEQYDIVREYPYVNYKSIDKAEKDLLLEYAPKPQEPCARLGYVSPEGHFYPCGYCCHNDLENILGEIIYDDSYCDLERKGWVALKGGALLCTDRDQEITQEAKDTLRKIVEAFELAESENPDIAWEPILWANPEGYGVQSGWSDPSGDLIHKGTYANALRAGFELHFGDYHAWENAKLITPSVYGRDITSKRVDAHPGD